MPCRDDSDYDQRPFIPSWSNTQEIINQAKTLFVKAQKQKELIDNTTALLCEACGILEEKELLTPSLQEWQRKHKKVDAKRLNAELVAAEKEVATAQAKVNKIKVQLEKTNTVDEPSG